ncbi:MAG: hypothetical protein JXA60_10985, partial [Candidatus Coatesbacteria bacterium]|nr:hypothetical protein [Candidatus Coatesbacteria bacterium]
MKKFQILILLIFSLSILYSQSYPMYGQNQHHTCHIDVAGPVTKPNEYWRFEEKEGRYAGNPVTDSNGNIYVGFAYEEDNEAYYCSLDSLGKIRWEKMYKRNYNEFYNSDCKVALDESRNRAYFSFTRCGGLFAHTLGGDLIWKFEKTYSYSPPTIRDNGYLYLGQGNGKRIICVSPEGALVWEFDGSGDYSLCEQNAIDDSGHVYIPLGNYLYCLNGD